MFAYCGNNAVVFCDCEGECPHNGIVPEVYNDDCLFCNPASKRYDILTSAFEIGIQCSIDLVRNALKYSQKPNNIAAGIYKKNVNAKLYKINNASSIADDVFTNLAYAGVFIEGSTGIYDNYTKGKSIEKIAWDATVDTVILSTNVYITTTFGAAIGTAIPIPIVGTLTGVAFGFLLGVVIDSLTYTPRQEIKNWVQ